MSQHKRFSKLQQEDSFVLEYMNWLGHHEFGRNHKIFNLGLTRLREWNDVNSIDYWLAAWINYYTYVLKLLNDKNLFLIDYSDLCYHPNDLLSALSHQLGIKLTGEQKTPYIERKLPKLDPNKELTEKAETIYHELVKNKMVVQAVAKKSKVGM